MEPFWHKLALAMAVDAAVAERSSARQLADELGTERASARNHTTLEPPLTTELSASQWEVWHKGPGEALLGINYSSPFASLLWFS